MMRRVILFEGTWRSICSQVHLFTSTMTTNKKLSLAFTTCLATHTGTAIAEFLGDEWSNSDRPHSQDLLDDPTLLMGGSTRKPHFEPRCLAAHIESSHPVHVWDKLLTMLVGQFWRAKANVICRERLRTQFSVGVGGTIKANQGGLARWSNIPDVCT